MRRNKIIPYRLDLKTKARKLRRESTYSEKLLWAEIRNKVVMGYQFHRQVPMLDYVVDFYCHELNLAIEVDGSSHDLARVQQYDKQRQRRLEKCGVHFIRINDLEVRQDIGKVIKQVVDWIVRHEAGV